MNIPWRLLKAKKTAGGGKGRPRNTGKRHFGRSPPS